MLVIVWWRGSGGIIGAWGCVSDYLMVVVDVG